MGNRNNSNYKQVIEEKTRRTQDSVPTPLQPPLLPPPPPRPPLPPARHILITGQGECGKTTLFKQILQIYKQSDITLGFLNSYKERIQQYCLRSMKLLIKQSKIRSEQAEGGDPQYRQELTRILLSLDQLKTWPSELCSIVVDYANLGCYQIAEYLWPSVTWVQKVDEDSILDTPQDMVVYIQALWADRGIQRTYEDRAEFDECAETFTYFYPKLEEICRESYTPSFQDVVMLRSKDYGFAQTQLELQGRVHTVVANGGRRDFTADFEATAVMYIYVAAISNYNHVTQADAKNTLKETIATFQTLRTSARYAGKPLILVLNKTDLFALKLKTTPLKDSFPEYLGSSYEDAVAFLKGEFFVAPPQPNDENVQTFELNATNTVEVTTMFDLIFLSLPR